jgi:hypothetical protein
LFFYENKTIVQRDTQWAKGDTGSITWLISIYAPDKNQARLIYAPPIKQYHKLFS